MLNIRISDHNFMIKVYDPPPYPEFQKDIQRNLDVDRRRVHYAADVEQDDSSSYGYYRRYQSPSPVPVHYRQHRSRATGKRSQKPRLLPKFEEEEDYNA